MVPWWRSTDLCLQDELCCLGPHLLPAVELSHAQQHTAHRAVVLTGLGPGREMGYALVLCTIRKYTSTTCTYVCTYVPSVKHRFVCMCYIFTNTVHTCIFTLHTVDIPNLGGCIGGL